MDSLDLRLIGLLRENARLPVALLAKQLGVSRATVQNRIDRLTDERVLLDLPCVRHPKSPRTACGRS